MIRLIRFADCPPVPWKNGAGATRELWRHEDAGVILIRISIAEITGEQPFSSFPDIDRMTLQLEGPPMTLTIDGQDCPFIPLRPQAFSGEAAVSCRLEGRGRALDLNLMCRRGLFRPAMELVSVLAGESLQPETEQGVSALLALGPCRLTGSVEAEIGSYDLLVVTGLAHVIPEQDAHFITLRAKLWA